MNPSEMEQVKDWKLKFRSQNRPVLGGDTVHLSPSEMEQVKEWELQFR